MQSIRWWDGIPDSMGMSLSKLWETVMDREAWLGVAKSRPQLGDGTAAATLGLSCGPGDLGPLTQESCPVMHRLL